MRKKRFLAIAAAITVSMTFAAPSAIFATEADESMDVNDDELEEGEQTTVTAPDAEGGEEGAGDEDGGGASSGGNSSGGSSAGSSTPAAKSSDSSLTHLGISPGSLSPAFSAGTYSYTATVDADVTKLSVAAKPNHSKAVIASVSGAKSITPGMNTVKVVVAAENGSTSTYTISVTCGSAAPTPAQPAETSGDASGENTGHAVEGEVSTVDAADPEEDAADAAGSKGNTAEVTFDSNGYLIYEGNAYLPSEMMPEGEYVSLDKYNKLYEQIQSQKSSNMRLIIIFVVVLVLLLIVILNLALKLRDVRQDAKLGISDLDADDGPVKKRSAKKAPDTAMIPDVKMPGQMKADTKKAERPAAAKTAAKAPAAAKTAPKAPAKSQKRAVQAKEDLEILDLNDL